MKKTLVLLLALVTAVSFPLSLSSCRVLFTGEETSHDPGSILSPEDIESIFAEVSDEVTEKYPTQTDSDGELIVYWLEGGSVWHASKRCPSIQKADADNLLCGGTADAVSAGKTRPCKICAEGIGFDEATDVTTDTERIETGEETEQYPKKYDATGALIVYWLDGGSVWHESDRCPSVTKADLSSVRSGTVNDAYYKGKKRACKICSPNSTETPDITVSTTEPDVTTERYLKEYDANGNLLVFWTESGSVWHECRACSSLSNTAADAICRGTESEALAQGKQRACKICSD